MKISVGAEETTPPWYYEEHLSILERFCPGLTACCLDQKERKIPIGSQIGILIPVLCHMETVLSRKISLSIVEITVVGSGLETVGQNQTGIKMMIEGAIDILPSVVLTESRAKIVDFVFPAFMGLDYGFLVNPIPKQALAVQILEAFEPLVWTCWILVLFFCTLVFHCIFTIRIMPKSLAQFAFDILFAKRKKLPWNQAISSQILITAWSLAAFIGMLFYKSVLIVLMSPDFRRVHLYDSVEGLLKLARDGTYKMTGLVGAASFDETFTDSRFRSLPSTSIVRIHPGERDPGTPSGWFRPFSRVSAIVYARKNRNLRFVHHRSGSYGHIVVRKDSALLQPLSRISKMLFEGGLFEHTIFRYLPKEYNKKIQKPARPIEFNQLKGCMIIFGCIYLCTVLMLFLELLYNRLVNSSQVTINKT